MNQTPQIASDLLANPPQELQEILAGASAETREALSSVAPNGHSSEQPTSALGEGRLQIVDEHQVFK